MPQRKYTREFKLSAVQLVNEQGYTIPQAAKSLGVAGKSVREWVAQFSGDDGITPRGAGGVTGRAAPAASRECAAFDGAGDFKKSGDVLCQGAAMKFAFIKSHRKIWPVTVMCRVLQVSRSGFFDWSRRPVSRRSKQQRELIEKIKEVYRRIANYMAVRACIGRCWWKVCVSLATRWRS
jgi:putative transposase